MPTTYNPNTAILFLVLGCIYGGLFLAVAWVVVRRLTKSGRIPTQSTYQADDADPSIAEQNQQKRE